MKVIEKRVKTRDKREKDNKKHSFCACVCVSVVSVFPLILAVDSPTTPHLYAICESRRSNLGVFLLISAPHLLDTTKTNTDIRSYHCRKGFYLKVS
jgi:hypothetical protein